MKRAASFLASRLTVMNGVGWLSQQRQRAARRAVSWNSFYRLSFALLALTRLLTATTDVFVSSVTAMQAVLKVDTSNSTSACTYEVSESPTYQPLVHDVDPALFNNANLDVLPADLPSSARTFVAGTRRVDTALNGKRYSRALQAATTHYVRITCGSDIVTTQFTTVTPPLGNAYPELPGGNPSAFGNLADPTIDWSDRSQTYVDPLTGVRLQRVTGPGEVGNLVGAAPFDYVLDVKGGWSNIAAAGGRQSGQYASTSSTNAPLFLAWNEIRNYQLTWSGANFIPSQGTVDDIRLRMIGGGSGGTLSVCISLDSGQTCASTALSVAVPAGSGQALTPVPSSFPSPVFAGWGRAFSNWDISNRSGTNAATTAGTQTISAPLGSFNVDWLPGVKIKVTGSGCNGNDVCTIASIQNTGLLTTVETIPNQVTNQNWQAYAAGMRITLASGSLTNISANYEYAESTQNTLADNPSQSYCSELTVNDVYKDRNGNALSSPLSGRLCNFVHGLYLAVDGTGEFRLLSNYLMNSRSALPGQPVNLAPSGAFSRTDAKTFYGNAFYNQGLFKGIYTGDYTPYKAAGATGYLAPNQTAADDNIIWTNVMPAGSASDINVQFPQYPGVSGFNSALMSQPSFSGLLAGYAEYFVGPGGSDNLCTVIRYNLETQKIQQVLTSWNTWPLRWGGCHFSPTGGGTYQIGAFNPINGHSVTGPLNGPFTLNLTQVMKDGQWNNNTAMNESVVRLASNTSPVVITTVTTYADIGYMGSNNHGLIDNEPVMIFGAQSNLAINTPANSSYYVKASYSDTTLSSPIGASDITINVVDGSRITSIPLIRIDSELIRCNNISGNQLTNCTRGSLQTTAVSHSAGTRVRQANSFALYQDRALTQPVSGTGDYAFNSLTFAMDIDPCPTGLDPKWTANMINDSGANGRRCTTVRVAGEPASDYAYWSNFGIGRGLTSVNVAGGVGTVTLSSAFSGWATGQQITISGANDANLNGVFNITQVNSTSAQFAAPSVSSGSHTEGNLTVRHATEHYLYPFKGDPTNLARSSLQDLQEGDFIHDVTGGQYGEQMVVVKKVKNSETDIILTLMRFWGDKVACDNHANNSTPQSHDNGWVPFMVPSYGCLASSAYADITDSTWQIADYRLAGEHGDIGPGRVPGTFTYVSSGGNTPVDNLSFSQIMATPPVGGQIRELPLFSGDTASLSYNGTVQGYGAYRQTTAPASEKVWKADFHALNAFYGAPQDTMVGLIQGMVWSKIRGTRYDPSSQTSIVYQVTGLPSGIDRKKLPMMGFAGYHYITDISGPGSVITDANRFNFCVADFPGECRPGSNQNDVFMAVPGADSSNNYCVTNSYENNVPCLFSASPYAGWAVQEQIDPPDFNGGLGRRLTLGFLNPGRHFSFSNWLPSPDAQYGFISPSWTNGIRNDVFAMKLPPWPQPESNPPNRADFVPLTVPVIPLPNAMYARAVFGYSENGPAKNFYCTTRAETCTTGGTPFAWLSEAQQPLACEAGCTLSIPAIPGRVVNYRIDWLDAAGNVLLSGPTTADAATP